MDFDVNGRESAHASLPGTGIMFVVEQRRLCGARCVLRCAMVRANV
jgi:hypothetical protein